MLNVPPMTTCGVINESPVGPLTLLFSPHGLTNLYYGCHLDFEPVGACFENVANELEAYFQGKLTSFSVELDPQGTPFQKRVWALLKTIPYGETRSYGQLARKLGNVNLARAVGHANRVNPIPIIYPCHRVIGSSGKLTGYLGGLHRKEILLNLEASFKRPELFTPL